MASCRIVATQAFVDTSDQPLGRANRNLPISRVVDGCGSQSQEEAMPQFGSECWRPDDGTDHGRRNARPGVFCGMVSRFGLHQNRANPVSLPSSQPKSQVIRKRGRSRVDTDAGKRLELVCEASVHVSASAPESPVILEVRPRPTPPKTPRPFAESTLLARAGKGHFLVNRGSSLVGRPKFISRCLLALPRTFLSLIDSFHNPQDPSPRKPDNHHERLPGIGQVVQTGSQVV